MVPEPSMIELLGRVLGSQSKGAAVTGAMAGAPRLTDLPFKSLDEYVFESFCATLAAEMWPGAHVQRFGGRGEKQHGIDVRVVTPAGERIGIQAKRYDKYQPASFKAAVSALDLAAAQVDRCVLMVTATVSVRVQQEAAKHAEWEIWDADVLSRTVAGLGKDAAVRIVDRYFPGLREPFLGVSAPSPWQTAEEAFDYAGQGDRFSHHWTLAGRADQLEELVGFGEDETAEASTVGLLVGAAGAGKSRLLKAMCERLERNARTTVRVVPREVPVPEAFELLPQTADLLVVVDDVQEFGAGLRTLVQSIRKQRPEAKILMAARPYGLPAIRDALRGLGIDHTTVPTWPLKELSTTEAAQLAAEALGSSKQHLAARLAHAAKDCPLLLISGAVQLRDGHLSTSVLHTDDEIRRQLAEAFLRTAVPDHTSDSVRARSVLRAVSLLQPFRENVPVYQQALADLTGQPFYDAAPHLRALEEAGVLLRRGTSLRIVPDLLGDVVLADAALLTTTGAPTGYLVHAHDVLKAQEPLLNALVNTSRVEWQWSQNHPDAQTLAESLWAEVSQAVQQAGPKERRDYLPFLRRVGVFQAGRTFSLVRWLYEHQPDAHLLHGLAPVLEAVAHDLAQTDEACDLLWKLGRDDERRLNAHPDHALRILTSLASYEVGKPFAFQVALIRAVGRWASDEQSSIHPRMPLELLDPIFAVTAESTIQDGWTLTLQRTNIPVEQLLGLRRQALDLLSREYAQPDPRRSARAALAFEAALRNTRNAGEEHVTALLQELRDQTRACRPGPVAAIGVRQAVDWNLTYGSETNKQAAHEVLDALPTSTGHDLAAALHTGWWSHLRRTRDLDDHQAAEMAWDTRLHATAEATKTWTPEHTWHQVQTLLADGYDVFGYTPEHAQPFMKHLLAVRPEMAQLICADAVQCTQRVQQAVMPTALRTLMHQNPESTIERAQELVTTGEPSLKLAVAAALAGPDHDLDTQVVTSLGQLLAEDPDPTVRCLLIRAAGKLSRTDHAAAVQLLATVPLMGSAEVASGIAMAITVFGWLSWTDLSARQATSLLQQLRRVRTLDDYQIQTLLSTLSASHSDDVLTLLMERVEHWEDNVEREPTFDPLPFQWHVPLRFSDTSDRLTYLRRILSWTANQDDGSRKTARRGHHAPELFLAVAGKTDRGVKTLLLEGLRSEPQERHAAAVLFRALEGDVVWQDPEFVSDALQAAAQVSEDLMMTVGSSLHMSVSSGTRVGTPGQPYVEDLEAKAAAERIVATLESGSVQERFYRSLMQSAEQRITWAQREDAEPDHRTW
ncbi:hypothetical protein ADL30_20505 [Streptomyces sp. NRRL S-1521]|nr:hypothetical protein ADL30_20505 [Streptomyces sp. NRRL S-1521]